MLLKLKVWIIPEEGRNLLKSTCLPLVSSVGNGDHDRTVAEMDSFFCCSKDLSTAAYIDNII